ncbi:hypothetical protein [Croceicoccus mobilis]|uniref:Stc1 domain-containing protein n=1 Tax=Croceicoccus mobilis TaxID=1703339 RepID=A0A917DQQ4_9SPHN|nr:hypothetical protein [Croceicoccus mobilis]GGD61785.1 hypothetical protein GCM10010990_09070 [Croceicoccus mobilis]
MAKTPPVPVPAGHKFCFGCSSLLPIDDFPRRRADSDLRTSRCSACQQTARDDRKHAKRIEREERTIALRDDIWAAMKRGRSTRALQAVKETPQGMHRMRVKDTPGFISIAELACRHAEREACRRAAKICKTFEAAADAARILEQATTTLDRTREMKRSWHLPPSRLPLDALQEPEGEDDEEADAFDEAFGDWAPVWMQEELQAA